VSDYDANLREESEHQKLRLPVKIAR